MSNHIQDAATRSGSRPHLERTHQTYPHTQVGDLNLRSSQAVTVHRSQALNVFNAQTLPTDCWDSPGFADIRLTGADIVQGLTVRMSIQNTTGAAVGPIPARLVWFLMTHIELLCENGSTVLERIEAEHLLNAWHKLGPYALERIRIGLQGGDETTAGFSIAAGDSTTLYIPLLETAIERLELPIFALAAPVIVRIHWRGRQAFRGTIGTAVPAGSVDVTRFDAVAASWKLPASERQELSRRFASAGLRGPNLDLRFARCGFQRSTETLTPGVEHLVRLSAVSGLVTSIAVALVGTDELAQYGSATATRTFLDGVDIRDERGSSLNGQVLDVKLLAMTTELHKAVSATASSAYFLEVPIGGLSGESSGQLHGYVPMNGYHQLVLKTKSGGATTAFEVVVIYRTVAVAQVNNGHIVVQHS